MGEKIPTSREGREKWGTRRYFPDVVPLDWLKTTTSAQGGQNSLV
jgi:hypothetical protein